MLSNVTLWLRVSALFFLVFLLTGGDVSIKSNFFIKPKPMLSVIVKGSFIC